MIIRNAPRNIPRARIPAITKCQIDLAAGVAFVKQTELCANESDVGPGSDQWWTEAHDIQHMFGVDGEYNDTSPCGEETAPPSRNAYASSGSTLAGAGRSARVAISIRRIPSRFQKTTSSDIFNSRASRRSNAASRRATASRGDPRLEITHQEWSAFQRFSIFNINASSAIRISATWATTRGMARSAILRTAITSRPTGPTCPGINSTGA